MLEKNKTSEIFLIRQLEEGGICRLILNRPSSYNSLSSDLLQELYDTFQGLHHDPAVRVVIVEGAGKGFCAGHDLREIESLTDPSKLQDLFSLCSKMMLSILRIRQPVIAKVHGAAFAAGCQLAATCDLAISSNSAVFATPGVHIGLFCSTPMVAVTRNLTRKEAMKMLLTGETVNAQKAKEIGLINDCVAENDLEGEVLKLARAIASKSAETIKIGKEAFYRQLEMPIEQAYEYASRIMAENMMTLDAKEGVCAFLEKRSPVWKDR